VEAYPGVLARHLIGRAGYKSDTPKKQTREQHQVRSTMLDRILNGQPISSSSLVPEHSRLVKGENGGTDLGGPAGMPIAGGAWPLPGALLASAYVPPPIDGSGRTRASPS
jgi:hypothetical protein